MNLAIDSIDDIAANSFRDFHVKGFDYLCLERSPKETVKVYFFEGEVTQLPEVVIPHDHRYPFTTMVLAGRSRNRQYRRGMRGLMGARPYEAFDYLTPLNGGDGFTWAETDWLLEIEDAAFEAGDAYSQDATDIHTIQVADGSTVLMLRQLADVVPIGTPTRAYQPEGMRQGPSLDGLYRRMTTDHVRKRLSQLGQLGLMTLVPA